MNWHDCFTYDAATGNLTWKERPLDHFAKPSAWKCWNKKYAHKRAGCSSVKRTDAIPLWVVGVGNRTRLAHRVIWEMHNGPIPPEIMIDHIDGNSMNNRLENLRLATHAENLWNRGKERGNKWGLKGVCWDNAKKKFLAQIKVNNKHRFLGHFTLKSMAAITYAKASLRYHGRFSVFYRQEIADLRTEKSNPSYQEQH